MVQGIVEQIGHGLTEQVAVTAHKYRIRCLSLQHNVILISEGLIKFPKRLHHGFEIGFLQRDRLASRFNAGNQQDGIEDTDQTIRFINDLFQSLFVVLIALGQTQRFVRPVAQAGERCFEVMGNIVRDFLEAGHQGLDTGQHGIHAFSQTVQFIAGSSNRQTA